MKIQNHLNLYLILVFVLLGPILLPFETYLWQLLFGLVGVFIAALLIMGSVIGGGDAKMLAAITPYIMLEDWPSFLMALVVFGLTTIIAHALMRLIPFVKPELNSWVSWQGYRKIPYGIAISGTFALYLLKKTFIL